MSGLAVILGSCDAVRPRTLSASDARIVEAAIFEGGYGIYWHKKIAEAYNAERAGEGVQVHLWGDPRMRDKIKPRILRGDPPDLILDQQLPVWKMIAAGKLNPFDEALAQPAPGSDKPWRELFIPGTLDAFTSDGKVYAIPSAFGAWGCWYDAKLFRQHGWQPPKTWAEFDALCTRIAEAGIPPLTFQGKYPYYAWFTYVSLAQRCGGLALVNRMNALEPGAFQDPGAVWAARLLQDLARKHFQRGAMAMTHLESQLEFVNNKAAMIFCGIWLENEMKASTPPDFELRCFNVPAVEGGKGNPRMFNGLGMEYIYLPADARYSDVAADFARYLVSPRNAPDMGRSIGAISPLNGACPREAVSPALQSVLDMMNDAMIGGAPGIFNVRLAELLLEWKEQVANPGLYALMVGDITPEEFGRRLDAGLQAAKSDPDVIIPSFIPYDPAAFGEASS
ncbi:MAG: carbohydrate ABC transporter, N-acetylglucosamine/diacetylchitobiose-binding protein [Candidatus Hydrogenedentota bacterium]